MTTKESLRKLLELDQERSENNKQKMDNFCKEAKESVGQKNKSLDEMKLWMKSFMYPKNRGVEEELDTYIKMEGENVQENNPNKRKHVLDNRSVKSKLQIISSNKNQTTMKNTTNKPSPKTLGAMKLTN
jgi:hypothetical protein